MTYPKLETPHVREFARTLIKNPDLDQESVDEFLSNRALDEPSLDLRNLESVASSLNLRVEADGRVDRALEDIEAEFSTGVFDAMETIPLEALGDVEFWSYISVKYFWQFVAKRQRGSVIPKPKEPMGSDDEEQQEGEEKLPIARYLIGKDHYQIPLRMFLRAQSVGGASFITDHPIKKGTDFWRSQILGVRTSAFPSWTRAVVAAQSVTQLNVTPEQRDSGKRINRLRANISMALHNDDEAAEIVNPLWREK